jgi:hypothetical protein
MTLSRDPFPWLNGNGPDGVVDHAFIYLPAQLDRQALCHPVAQNMYKDIAVHRPCCYFGK